MPLDHEGTPRKRAFLLRMWQVPSQEAEGARAWRFSLVDPETGEKQGFSDLGGLVAFLEGEMGEQRAHTVGLEPRAGAKSAAVSPTG
jgi:hypothetical protein